jgi:hypothetical protein
MPAERTERPNEGKKIQPLPKQIYFEKQAIFTRGV